MRKLIGLSLAMALALTALTAIPTAAGPNTKVDVGLEFGDAIDHLFVNTNQNGVGDLRIVVKLHKVPEGASDWYIEVWCGPDHTNPLTQVGSFSMTTNAKGSGNSGALWISAADLTADCGSGPGTGHVDVGIPPFSAEYTATPIPYTAP